MAEPSKPYVPVVHQASAGGVAFRKNGAVEVALIRTVEEGRWQLPKGIIDPGENPEQAALREVREEAGISCEIIAPIDVIEYWFFGNYDGTRKRYHKEVHFFLMRYVDGNVADHDHEVTEARWVTPEEGLKMLSFKNEKDLLSAAVKLIDSQGE